MSRLELLQIRSDYLAEVPIFRSGLEVLTPLGRHDVEARIGIGGEIDEINTNYLILQ